MEVLTTPWDFLVPQITFVYHKINQYLGHGLNPTQMEIVVRASHGSLIVKKHRQVGFTTLSIAYGIDIAARGGKVLFIGDNFYQNLIGNTCFGLNGKIMDNIFVSKRYDLTSQILNDVDIIIMDELNPERLSTVFRGYRIKSSMKFLISVNSGTPDHQIDEFINNLIPSLVGDYSDTGFDLMVTHEPFKIQIDEPVVNRYRVVEW